MKILFYYLLYLIFLISSILYGSLYIGPVTPRQIMSVVMIVVCIKEGYLFFDKYAKLYFGFVFFYLVACFSTGGFDIALRNLLSYYLVAFVGYQSTRMIISKYRGARFVLLSLLSIFFVDAVVTLIQMWQRPLSYIILDTLNITAADELLERAELREMDTLAGLAVPGIVGSVLNGYVLAVSCALIFYNKSARLKFWNIILLMFFLVSVFVVQERTALFAAGFISILMIVKLVGSSEEKNKVKWIFFFIAIILIIVFGSPLFYDSILDDGFRYSESSFSIKEDARSHIWSEAWDFIQSTPVGGIFYYTNTHIKMPHNFFLNAFIYGGIFGGLFLITLFVEQMIIVLKILIQKLSANNILSLVFAGAYLAYSINTMTHNSSLADGNLLVWLLWGAIISTRNGINNIKK